MEYARSGKRQDMDDINKRLCELLGCDVPSPKDTCPLCGKTNTDGKFIDGADFFTERGRIDLLKRMRKSGVWWKFLEVIGSDRRWCEELAGDQKIDMICIDYILDDTGSLARAVLEFLEGKA
jgi:hypothetical protein